MLVSAVVALGVLAPGTGAAAAAGTSAGAPLRATAATSSRPALRVDATDMPLDSAPPRRAGNGYNRVVDRFHFRLIACATDCRFRVPKGAYALLGFLLSPFYRGDLLTGGCTWCTGRFHFRPYSLHRHVLRSTVAGHGYMTVRTRFYQGVLRPGTIGRLRGFRVLPPPRHPKRLSDRCLGADTITDVEPLLLHHRKLPVVPCNATVPDDPPGTFSTPLELSPTQQLDADVRGHVDGHRWLSLFTMRRGDCQPDAQAEYHFTKVRPLQWRVSGSFDHQFLLGPGSQAGRVCEYIETGALWRGIPDGLVTVIGDHPYYPHENGSAALRAP